MGSKGQATNMLTKSVGGQVVLEGCKLLELHRTCSQRGGMLTAVLRTCWE